MSQPRSTTWFYPCTADRGMTERRVFLSASTPSCLLKHLAAMKVGSLSLGEVIDQRANDGAQAQVLLESKALQVAVRLSVEVDADPGLLLHDGTASLYLDGVSQRTCMLS